MTSASRLGRRGMQALQQELSPRDRAVLTDVRRLRLVSGAQLARLHFPPGPSGARTARRVLARLTRDQLLSQLHRRVGGIRAGSQGAVFALGPRAARVLGTGLVRRRAHEVSDGFLRHTLTIGEIYIGLREAERRGQLELLRLDTEPQCWQQLPSGSGTRWLKPDLHVVLVVGPDEIHSYVEVDLGSEHRPALRRKMRLYEDAYRGGGVEHSDGVFPRVVWLVPDSKRAAVVASVARETWVTTDLHAVLLIEQAIDALSGVTTNNQHQTKGGDT